MPEERDKQDGSTAGNGADEPVEVLGGELSDPVDEDGAGEAEGDPIARLHAELAEARQAAEDFKDRLYRKAAELENTKRRLNKQIEDVRTYAGEEVLRELLPVVDDLERAIGHARRAADESGAGPEDPVRGFVDGTELVLRKLVGVLGRFGVAPFDSMGQRFDPQVHEAISQMETADHPEGTVVGEFLKGYNHFDKLLRPAVVTVARAPAGSSGSQG